MPPTQVIRVLAVTANIRGYKEMAQASVRRSIRG